MNQRTFVFILIPVVLVLSIGALWILKNQADSSEPAPVNGNDSPIEGMDRFEGYGFSIDYPSDMSIEVLGVRTGEANESMGSVEGTLIGQGVEIFVVTWVKQESLPSSYENTLEGVLDFTFAGIEEEFQTSDRGEIQTGSKDGHDMIYQTFISYADPTRSRVRGYPLSSIWGAWYCEEAGQYLLLCTAHMPSIYQPNVLSEEVESMWQEYLDSLICH